MSRITRQGPSRTALKSPKSRSKAGGLSRMPSDSDANRLAAWTVGRKDGLGVITLLPAEKVWITSRNRRSEPGARIIRSPGTLQ